MLDSYDRVRFTTQVDREYGGRVVLTFMNMSAEEGREITALVSRLNDQRERRKTDKIKIAGDEPAREYPAPEPKAPGNRFSGLDLK